MPLNAMCEDYKEQLEESILDEICDAGFCGRLPPRRRRKFCGQLIISIVGDEYG